MPDRPRILLAQPLDADAEARLVVGATVVRASSPTEPELLRHITDCDALIGRTTLRVSAALITAAPRLRVIGVAGVGIDNVDVHAARERGIAVLHTPAASTDAVAELAVLLMLQHLRPVARLADAYRAGRFDAARAAPHGVELRSLTVGIVGLGRIGRRVAEICNAGFASRVLFNDILDMGTLDFAATAVSKDELWAASDIVTLHVPLTPQTHGMIDERVLRQMKSSALLVNTSRGAVVDTAALLRALNDETIAAAALDVTEPEPLPRGHPLLHHERCMVTPHVAARTHAGVRRMMAIVDEVLQYLTESAAGSRTQSG